ncbi:DUF433 domain-containing protein [Gellertiella hungarica]|uniref:Uncharacterized protein (DUF433 family) n=1 Tax=Gellertiella hungarica TaxID=1572859 RepID=A0A7W6J6M6_9HYPH|nr:DUF433 domain-containing protein [Gellertiella hungarica]MBB4065749.1 uncharacterized protein (DUF433 family) [Gellertiella hungarica]
MFDTKKDVRTLSARAPSQIGKVSRNRRIAHNMSVVAGTRVPVRSIREFAEAGYSAEKIAKEYPTLTIEDIKAVLENDRAA